MTALPACDGVKVNLLQGIALEPGQTLALDTPIKFILSGQGRCGYVNIDWGDGFKTSDYGYPGRMDLSGSDVTSRTLTHSLSAGAAERP